jgi:hypothetical protein
MVFRWLRPARDSDILEESNFQVASEALLALSTALSVETTDMPGRWDGEQSVRIVRENHWAIGWVEWIAIHSSNSEALTKARGLCESANDYPILDESHFSDLEYTRAMEFWDSSSLSSKSDYCRDCGVSIFAARRNHDLPDRLWECLTAN